MCPTIKRQRFELLRQLLRFTWRRKLWFLIPFFLLMVVASLLLVVLDSPALIPFFYALF